MCNFKIENFWNNILNLRPKYIPEVAAIVTNNKAIKRQTHVEGVQPSVLVNLISWLVTKSVILVELVDKSVALRIECACGGGMCCWWLWWWFGWWKWCWCWWLWSYWDLWSSIWTIYSLQKSHKYWIRKLLSIMRCKILTYMKINLSSF